MMPRTLRSLSLHIAAAALALAALAWFGPLACLATFIAGVAGCVVFDLARDACRAHLARKRLR